MAYVIIDISDDNDRVRVIAHWSNDQLDGHAFTDAEMLAHSILGGLDNDTLARVEHLPTVDRDASD